MLTDEMLFDGAHFAHISLFYERKRLARIRETVQRATPAPRGRGYRISADSVWPLRGVDGKLFSERNGK